MDASAAAHSNLSPVRLLRIELNAALQSCRSRSAGKNSDAPNCHGAESSLLTVCENGAVLARKRSIARQALFGSSGSEWVTTTAIGATADSRNVLRAWFRRARIPVPAGRPPTHSVVATVTYRRPSWISVRRHTGASGPAPPRIPWACRTMSAPPPDSASRSDANSGRTPIRGGKRWKVVTKSRSSQRYCDRPRVVLPDCVRLGCGCGRVVSVRPVCWGRACWVCGGGFRRQRDYRAPHQGGWRDVCRNR